MNIVTATFSAGCTQIDADRKLWQYDQGQILQLVGLELPDAYQVEFSNSRDKGSAKAQIGGPDGVQIPDEYLTTGKPVYAFLVGHTAEEDRETEKLVVIYVNARSQPTDEPITPEQQTIVDQLIAALTAGVAKAEDAAAQAEAAISYMPKIVDGTWWVYDAETETWADTGIQAEGQDGVGISGAVLNADYTLTLTFSDGTSYTTPSIRGPKGEDAPTDYILVQPTQPTSPTNRLWVDSDRGSTVQLPTMADHQALAGAVADNTEAIGDLSDELADQKSALNTKLPFLEKSAEGSENTETALSFPNVGQLSTVNGAILPSETAYKTTDYIDIDGVTGIYRTGTTIKFALWIYCFYDSEYNYLGYKGSNTYTDYTIETYNGKQVTWLDIDDYPSAKYIRITWNISRPYTYWIVKNETIYKYVVPHITVNGIEPLKFYGKTIVNFGDSIFGNFRDTNETTDKSISRMIAEATRATVYNCGFGGCRMSYHSAGWRAFSMYALADAITTGVWTEQDSAIASPPTGLPSYFSETLALLKSINFNDVDYITIGYGVNDFNGNIWIDARSGLEEYQYFKGALEYSLRTILTTYPNIRIVDITPCWMWYPNTDTGLLDYDSDNAQAVNTRNLTLPDYVEACKEVCKKYHVPCIDTYEELGFNPYSYKAYFNVKGVDGSVVSDGVHPKQSGRQLRADRIVGQLEALY